MSSTLQDEWGRSQRMEDEEVAFWSRALMMDHSSMSMDVPPRDDGTDDDDDDTDTDTASPGSPTNAPASDTGSVGGEVSEESPIVESTGDDAEENLPGIGFTPVEPTNEDSGVAVEESSHPGFAMLTSLVVGALTTFLSFAEVN